MKKAKLIFRWIFTLGLYCYKCGAKRKIIDHCRTGAWECPNCGIMG